MKKITLLPFPDEGIPRIGIRFEYDESIIEEIRKLRGRQWSPEEKIWHIEYSEEKPIALKDYLSSSDIYVDDSAFRGERENSFMPAGGGRREHLLGKINSRYLQCFVKWMETRRYSKRSVDTYSGLITTFLQYYNDRSPSEFTIGDITRYNYDFILKKEYSISYQRQMVSALKLFFQQIYNRKPDINQLERPYKEKKLPVVFSKEEVRRIISSIKNEKHRVMIVQGPLRFTHMSARGN